MYTKKEREYYNIHRDRTCEALGITKNQYNWFRRKGKELHKFYEAYCNGENVDNYQWCLVTDALEDKAEELNLDIFFQTDPRGATIYLDTKPIPNNNYTTAHCIY